MQQDFTRFHRAFSLPFASHARKVIGIEESDEAVRWGRVNAKLNEVENIEFLAGTSEEQLRGIESGSAEIVFLDPPRRGMLDKALQHLIRIQPNRILYLSCNPSTLVRDLKALLASGSHLKKVLAADFFPQTAQIEALALLER